MKVRLGVTALLLTSVLGLAGCGNNNTAEEDVVGSLELQQAQSGVNVEYEPVGELVVEESGAPIYDSFDGVSVGRIGEGEYPVYDVTKGWLQVELAEVGEDSDSFVWVPPNNGKYKPEK